MKKIWFKVKFNKLYEDLSVIDENTLGDYQEFGESEAVLALPDSYTDDGDPTPLIFAAHGSGGHVCEAKGETGGIGYAVRCIETGYAAFDIHGTREDGRSYGNRRYCEAVHRAYIYVLNHYNVQPGLFVTGASMGGVCTLNFVSMYPRDVRVLGLFYPRTNLHAETACGKYCVGPWEKPFQEKKGFKPSDRIAEEYGFEKPDVWEEEKTIGLNPWHNKSVVVDGLRYTTLPCPIKIWHGNADPTIDYELSVEYVAALRRAGCFAELRTIDNHGHKHNDTMHEELRIWFDRFN